MAKIRTSDIYEHSDDLKKLIEEIERLTALRNAEIENAKALRKEIEKLNTSQKDNHEAIEDTSKSATKIEKALQKYNAALDDNNVKVEAIRNATREMNRLNKVEAKILASKEGSYNNLSARYSKLKIQLNQMTKAERENTKQGKVMVKQSKELYEKMKELQEATGKHTLSVGDYGKALRDLDGNIGEAANGISGFAGKIKGLLKNPIVLFLAAVVGGVMDLVNAFKRSEKGAELMARVTGVTNAVMSELVDVSVKVVEGLQNAFENPQETFKNFGKSIVENVLNRLESIPLLLAAVGKAIKALWNRDMDELKQAGEDAFTAINQGITGLDEEQQSNFAKAVKETVKEVNEEATAFADLEVKKRNYAKANRALAKSIESLTTKEQEYQLIADDSTKSFKEQEDAAKEARKAIEQRASAEIQLAKNNLSLINAEIDLRKSNHENVETLLDAQLNAYREVMSAEREHLIAVKSNEKTVRQLKQDRLERDLDILIDGFDNQKTINERRLRDEKLTEDERIQLLQETKKLADDSFLKQIETIEKFTGERIDSNELISESDAVALNKKIRNLGLSEIIEGRVLEIIRERKTATQDLSETEKDAVALNRKLSLEAFDNLQAAKEAEFNTIERTEKEKTAFTLQAQKERYEKLLKLEQQYGATLSDVQVKTIQAQIQAIDNELTRTGQVAQDKSIFKIFGFEVDDEQKSIFKQSLSTTKQYINDFIASWVEQTGKVVDLRQKEKDAAQEALDYQISLRDQGLAYNITAAQKELEAAKANEAKALKEQEKAQKAQLALQSIEQASNLVTATTKIWKSLAGFPPLAIAATALMWGSFAASKIKAFQLTKATFGEGGLEILGGGTHASGNDTPLGFSVGGRPAYGERGEAHAIIPATTTRKYKAILPEIIDSLRFGTFEQKFQRANSYASSDKIVFIGQGSTMDTSIMERHLSNIDRNSQQTTQVNVIIKGNQKIKHI